MQCKVFDIEQKTNVHQLLNSVHYWVEQITSDPIKITESVIVCSELAYNIIKYGHCGTLRLFVECKSLFIEANDNGNGFGIPLESAFAEGISSSGSLGLGMASIVRLCDDFSLQTSTSGTHIYCRKLIL